METITSSPGLFHIAKKILSILTKSNPANVDSIRNLRLTNVGWKSVIESKDMCKFWQKIYLCQQDEFPEQTFDLISILYKKAYKDHDRKLMWLLSHYVIVTLASPNCRVKKANMYKEYYWHGNSFDYPKPIEVFLCNGPFDVVEALFKTIDITKDLDIYSNGNSKQTFLALLKTASIKFFREDLVKLFCHTYPKYASKIPATFISNIVWLVTSYNQQCMAKYQLQPTMKTKLIKILAFFIDNLSDTDHLIKKANTNFIKSFCLPAIKDYSGCTCVMGMINKIPGNPLTQENNVLITALHNDVDYQNIDLINALLEPLRRAKFDMNTDAEVLEVINEYAAMKGYLEIAKIVAEKMGMEAYADLAMIVMDQCIHWMDESVLKFMASVIDEQDVKKINNYEETSLHAAAKKGFLNYIINFAPFSSTSHKKDQNGKTALLLIWEWKKYYSNDQFGIHGNAIQAKAETTLMACVETRKVQKDFDELNFYDLEPDSDDDYFEESEENDSEVDENDIETSPV